MSGGGGPDLDLSQCADVRVCVVASSWHDEVMHGLIRGTDRALEEAGIVDAPMVRVPGAFELPVAVKRAADTRAFEAVVALGVVVRGGTPHFDYVCQATSSGLIQASVATGIPVGFGLLTCDDLQQALDRAGGPGASEDKGHEATAAALITALRLRTLPLSD